MNTVVQRFQMDNKEYVGILFAVNRKRQWALYSLWVSVCVILVGATLIVNDSGTQAGFLGMGAVICVMIGTSIRNGLRGVNGIAITEHALIWSLIIGGVFIIPWDQVLNVKLLSDRAAKPPIWIGLNLRNPQAVARSRGDLKNLEGWFRISGWHLRYDKGNLSASLESVIQTITYFWKNPESRSCLCEQFVTISELNDVVWPPPPSVNR